MFRWFLIGLLLILTCAALGCIVTAIAYRDERFFVVAALPGMAALAVVPIYLIVAAWTAERQWASGMERAADALGGQYARHSTPEFTRTMAQFLLTPHRGARLDHLICGERGGRRFSAAILRFGRRRILVVVVSEACPGAPDFWLTATERQGTPFDLDIQDQASREICESVYSTLAQRGERLRGWSAVFRDRNLLVYRLPTVSRDLSQSHISVEERVFREINETLDLACEIDGWFRQKS